MKSPDTSRTFGNFDLWLEDILAPAGVKDPPTSNYQLCLVVQPCGTADTQKFYVSMSQLASLDVEQHASGCIYQTEEEKRQAITYIRDQASQLLKQKPAGLYFPSAGWYKLSDGRSAFCSGNELLPAATEDQLPEPCPLLRSRVYLVRQSSADINAIACQFCESLWDQPEYRIPAYSYTLFSSLRSRWEEVDLPSGAVLFIVGKSGTGKTTLAKNFCQVFDYESGGIADYWDAEASQAALTDALYEARDRTVLYDDICKSTTTAEERNRMDRAANLLRHVANGTDRGKKSGQETVRHICRAGLVITAEKVPTIWSELSRCILLQVERFQIGGTSMDRELAAGMLRGYLEWFARHDDRELENLRHSKAVFTTDRYPGLTRLYTSMMQLNWCFESFMRFLETIPSCRAYIGEQQNKTAQIYRQLFEKEVQLIRSMEQSRLPIEKQILIGLQSKQLPCTMHKESYCIRFDALMAFLRQSMQDPALSERRISTYLRANQLIDTDASQRVSKKVDGKRYVFLKPERF